MTSFVVSATWMRANEPQGAEGALGLQLLLPSSPARLLHSNLCRRTRGHNTKTAIELWRSCRDGRGPFLTTSFFLRFFIFFLLFYLFFALSPARCRSATAPKHVTSTVASGGVFNEEAVNLSTPRELAASLDHKRGRPFLHWSASGAATRPSMLTCPASPNCAVHTCP